MDIDVTVREPRPEKEYLGDGVYASFDGYHIELRANDPVHGPVIYMEPQVYQSLTRYAKKIWGGT